MSRECQEIRADRGMRSARRPYPLVHEKDRSGNMVGRSELEKG